MKEYEKKTIEMLGITEVQFIVHKYLKAYVIVETGEEYLKVNWKDLEKMTKDLEMHFENKTLFKRFINWFNRKFGWFFTNGRKQYNIDKKNESNRGH